MAEEIGQVGVGIVADNRVQSGTDAALKTIEKEADKAYKRLAKQAQAQGYALQKINRDSGQKISNDNDQTTKKMASSWVTHLSKIEQATSKVFGNGSATAGLASKMREAKEAGSAMGSVLAEVAATGEGMAARLGPIGAIIGGIVIAAGAATYAGMKLAAGWSKTAASIGYSAQKMGVSAKGLQQFMGFGERVGVDKEAAGETLGNLQKTLNDGAIGANPQAQAEMAFLGLRTKRRADGTVDAEAMLPDIADAITRQTPQARLTIAQRLGISPDALQMFTQGGDALKRQMAASPNVMSGSEIARGQETLYKDKLLEQQKSVIKNEAGATAAWATNPVLDGIISGMSMVVGGGKDIKAAGGAFGKAVDEFSDDVKSAAPSGPTDWHITDPRPAPKGGGPVPFGNHPSGGASRAERDNNPGNLEAVDRYGRLNKWTASQPGYRGNDGRFAIFDSPESGFAAQTKLLEGSYINKGFDTPLSIAAKYAPPGENDSVAYAWRIANMLGIKPTDHIPASQVPQLARAMDSIEGYRGADQLGRHGGAIDQPKLKVDVHIHNGKVAATTVTHGGGISHAMAN